MLIVHDLAEQSKVAKVGKTTATTRCGLSFDRNSAERLPGNLTAWPSRVTRPGCREANA